MREIYTIITVALKWPIVTVRVYQYHINIVLYQLYNYPVTYSKTVVCHVILVSTKLILVLTKLSNACNRLWGNIKLIKLIWQLILVNVTLLVKD